MDLSVVERFVKMWNDQVWTGTIADELGLGTKYNVLYVAGALRRLGLPVARRNAPKGEEMPASKAALVQEAFNSSACLQEAARKLGVPKLKATRLANLARKAGHEVPDMRRRP